VKRSNFITDAIVAGGLTAALGTRAGAQAVPALNAAGVMNETAALLFYAADMGFYDKAGVRVSTSVLGNSGAISAAIASGAIQVGSFAISVGALARQRGVPLVLIAPAGLYLSTTPTSGLIVRKDSPYTKAADLNGKTIATRDLANMSYFGAKQWMDKNGGDSKSVKWIEVPDTSVVPALQAGRFDAASISEPALGDAIRGGDMRSLASVFDSIAKRFLISGYFTSEDVVKSQPDAIRKFAAVMNSTAVWANHNLPASAKILEKYEHVPVPPGSPRVTFADRLRASDVQPVLDVMYDYGSLKAPMRANEMFSPLIPAQ
jgi:NitT/TauT family transport system substrate-binding protein